LWRQPRGRSKATRLHQQRLPLPAIGEQRLCYRKDKIKKRKRSYEQRKEKERKDLEAKLTGRLLSLSPFFFHWLN
jgi:hypothetical protein